MMTLTTDNLKPQIVIFAYGNPSRGDDALGPALLHLIEETYSTWENIELLEDFQLQVEHALDLINRDIAIFIDASVACSPPFTFAPLQPQLDRSYTTHALHPAAILQVYQELYQRPPPPTFLLSIRGEQFELGESLSDVAKQNLAEAWEFMKQWLETESLKLS